MPENDQRNRPTENRRFTIVDQQNQRVGTQYNTVTDRRDQRDQRVGTQYNIISSDPTAVLSVINRNRPGVVFQLRVLGSWFILSIVSVIFVAISSASSGSVISLGSFIGMIFEIFIAYVVYGFIGIIIQSAFDYQWRFRDVKNRWFVWCLYPILSLWGIALWIVWLMLWIVWLMFRFSPNWFRF